MCETIDLEQAREILTDAQFEVIERQARGLSLNKIADDLQLSRDAVRQRLAGARHKMGLPRVRYPRAARKLPDPHSLRGVPVIDGTKR